MHDPRNSYENTLTWRSVSGPAEESDLVVSVLALAGLPADVTLLTGLAGTVGGAGLVALRCQGLNASGLASSCLISRSAGVSFFGSLLA